MNKNELLYEALLKHYEGKKASAKATLAVYFDNAAGIGEHPQVVEEMANAEDCIESIKRNLDVF